MLLVTIGAVAVFFVGVFFVFQNTQESLEEPKESAEAVTEEVTTGEKEASTEEDQVLPPEVLEALGQEGETDEETVIKEDMTNEESQEDSSAAIATSATIKTAKGDIVLELYPEAAPKTVENFAKLARDGFYDGIKFHRVIASFMIQGGDPLSKTDDPRVGSGGPGYSFQDEINPRSLSLTDEQITQLEEDGYVYDYTLESHAMDVGVLAMANSGPNTNGSQFFIVTQSAQPHLNGKHTVFGKVTQGMEVVRAIQQGDEMTTIEVGNQ